MSSSARYPLKASASPSKSLLASGGVSFAAWMRHALYGVGGYYQRHVHIGGQGADFYTAAQSRLFAVAIGHEVLSAWLAAGAPRLLQLVEMGPGEGVLAENLLPYLRERLPFGTELRYFPVDVSSMLGHRQLRRLEHMENLVQQNVQHISSADYVFVYGNEVLDALPVERLKRCQNGWERMVMLPDGTVDWQRAPGWLGGVAERWLPIARGECAELCLEYRRWMEWLRRGVHADDFLFLDYGLTLDDLAVGLRPSGTVRGFRQQTLVDPMNVTLPSSSLDWTADVHWDAVRNAAREQGYETSLTTQGKFLMERGIVDAAENALAGADLTTSLRIRTTLKQLVMPQGMGERFEVLRGKLLVGTP